VTLNDIIAQEVAAALNASIRGDYLYFEKVIELSSSYDPLSLLSPGMLPDSPDFFGRTKNFSQIHNFKIYNNEEDQDK